MKIRILLLSLIPTLCFSQQAELYNSYLAHIAAANSSLRLNEGKEAAIWLSKAPASFRNWEWDLLNKTVDQSEMKVALQNDIPTKVSVNDNGTLIAVGSVNGNIYLIKSATFEIIYSKHIHNGAIYDIKFSETGEEVYTCSSDTTIQKFNLLKKEVVWAANSGGHGIADIDVNNQKNVLLFVSWTKKEGKVVGIISIFDAQKGRRIWNIEYGDKPIVTVEISKDGRYFAAGTWGGQVPVWDLNSKMKIRNFDFNDVNTYSAIEDIAFSPDSKSISAASKSSRVRVWDIELNQLKIRLTKHNKPFSSLIFNKDGSRIITSDIAGTICKWDLKTGNVISKYFGHTSKINSLCYLESGNKIISSSNDNTIRQWNNNVGAEFSDWSKRNKENRIFGLSKSSNMLATSGPNSSITIWNVRDGLPIINFLAMDKVLNAIDFSDNDSMIVGCNWDDVIKVWNTNTGKVIGIFSGMPQGGTSCDFHPNSKLIAAASNEGAVYIWDISKSTPIAKLAANGIPYFVKFSPDGKKLAAANTNGKVVVWNVGKYDLAKEIQAHNYAIYSLDFSNDSKKILTASEDNSSRIFNLEDGKMLNEFIGHSQKVLCAAFSKDETRVVTGSADLTLRFWDTKTNATTLVLGDFYDPISNVIFSNDNQKLFVSTSGTEIKLYNRSKPVKKY